MAGQEETLYPWRQAAGRQTQPAPQQQQYAAAPSQIHFTPSQPTHSWTPPAQSQELGTSYAGLQHAHRPPQHEFGTPIDQQSRQPRSRPQEFDKPPEFGISYGPKYGPGQSYQQTGRKAPSRPIETSPMDLGISYNPQPTPGQHYKDSQQYNQPRQHHEPVQQDYPGQQYGQPQPHQQYYGSQPQPQPQQQQYYGGQPQQSQDNQPRTITQVSIGQLQQQPQQQSVVQQPQQQQQQQPRQHHHGQRRVRSRPQQPAGRKVFTPEQIARYRNVFDMFDINKNGVLEGNELAAVSQVLGYRIPKEQLHNILSHFDLDINGVLTFDEFLEAMPGNLTLISEEDHRKADYRHKFQQFDKDCNGYITRDEAFDVLHRELGFTDMQTKGLINQFDVNADGRLSYEEFIGFYMKISQRKGAIDMAFRQFDREGKGYVTVNDAKRILGGLLFSDMEVEALVRASDTNRDGKLQYEEFVHFWTV